MITIKTLPSESEILDACRAVSRRDDVKLAPGYIISNTPSTPTTVCATGAAILMIEYGGDLQKFSSEFGNGKHTEFLGGYSLGIGFDAACAGGEDPSRIDIAGSDDEQIMYQLNVRAMGYRIGKQLHKEGVI